MNDNSIADAKDSSSQPKKSKERSTRGQRVVSPSERLRAKIARDIARRVNEEVAADAAAASHGSASYSSEISQFGGKAASSSLKTVIDIEEEEEMKAAEFEGEDNRPGAYYVESREWPSNTHARRSDEPISCSTSGCNDFSLPVQVEYACPPEIPTAFLVNEEVDKEEVFVATKAPWYSSRRFVVFLSITAASIILGLVVGLGPLGASPPPVDTTEYRSIESLREMVAMRSADKGSALLDTASNQTAALNWIWKDQNLPNYSDTRILERYALATLFFGTAGEKWSNRTNWIESDVSECDWHAVFCNDDNMVSKIQLEDNSLSGELPGEFFHFLGKLFELDLSRNGLRGTLPEDLGTNIGWFRIHHNDLSGTLPAKAFARLTHLRSMHLNHNQFFGTIPPLSHLQDLRALRLNDNHLRGTLSSQFGNLESLESLWVNDNLLTGTLPASLGNLPRLRDIYAHDNIFSGTIPSELGKLTTLGKGIHCSSCVVVGLIVNGFYAHMYHGTARQTNYAQIFIFHPYFDGIDELYFEGNKFSGSMPSEICELLNRNLFELRADCRAGGSSYVSCGCCTGCYRDGEEEMVNYP